MKAQFRVLAISLFALAGISACGGGGGDGGGSGSQAPVSSAPPAPPPAADPPAPPAAASVDFTAYSKQMYADSEAATSWDVENVTFNFDSDEDPTAYDDLMPPES